MTHVITRSCGAYRPFGADDLARVAAREALAVLTEREVASFALSLLLQVDQPVMCSAMAAASRAVADHAAELHRRAAATDRGQ